VLYPLSNRSRTLFANFVAVKSVQWRETLKNPETPKSTKRKRKRGSGFSGTHCSRVRILLCFSASPIAAAPPLPMLLPLRLCGKRKGEDEDNAQGQWKERVDSQE
jgi:hypothetical protein